MPSHNGFGPSPSRPVVPGHPTLFRLIRFRDDGDIFRFLNVASCTVNCDYMELQALAALIGDHVHGYLAHRKTPIPLEPP